jgi:XTP/dITP diphosphohydrolase
VIDLTFVSTNPGKVREIRAVLRPFGVRVRWLRRRLPEPQAETLEEVVGRKLDAVRDVRGKVLVEDSGLFIPALRGFPGVYSAHFLKVWRFAPIFELLERRDRRAYFRTVAGLQENGRRVAFVGEVRGRIADKEAGTNGFGYDPIFVPAGWTRTFAEAEPGEKNAISHRARAMRKLGQALASGHPFAGPR